MSHDLRLPGTVVRYAAMPDTNRSVVTLLTDEWRALFNTSESRPDGQKSIMPIQQVPWSARIPKEQLQFSEAGLANTQPQACQMTWRK